MSKDPINRELLRDKVVDLVKEFIETEGGIELYDLLYLFGAPCPAKETHGVATALAQLPIFIGKI